MSRASPHGIVGWLRPTFTRSQYFVYLLGCVLFSLGAVCFIQAKLGTDPLDVFALGLRKQVPWMTVGMAQGGIAVLCLAIWSFWNKKLPIVSPFVTFFLCGSLIDLGLHYHDWLVANLPLAGYPLMFLAVFLCAYASSLIIMSGIGIRAMDLVAITMVYKWKAPFVVWKTLLEACLLLAGFLMGGPVGPGTIAFLTVVDLLIQPMMIANQRYLGLRNHGLRGRKEIEQETAANFATAT